MKRGRERRAFSGAGYIFWGKPLCPPPMLESLPKTSFLGFEVFIGSLEGRAGALFQDKGMKVGSLQQSCSLQPPRSS